MPMLPISALSSIAAGLASAARAADDPTLWYVTRAAAISAYILLAGAAALGLVRSILRATRSRSAGTIWLVDEAHKFAALLAAAFVGLHLVTLLFDPVVPFTLANLLIPVGEPYRALAMALGVLGMYALAAVLASSWLRRSLSYGFWRDLHYLTFPAFALLTLHGILAGADSAQPWMFAVYWTAAGTVLLLTALRLFLAQPRPAQA